MITIQLLLLGAICATAWYIINKKEKEIKSLKQDLKAQKTSYEWLCEELQLVIGRRDYWINKYFTEYGLNKVRKATSKKLHKLTRNGNKRQNERPVKTRV